MENPDVVLRGLLYDMHDLLIAAGIPKSQVNVRAGKHKIDTYNKAFDWLHDLSIHHSYTHHVRMYNLVTPETWEQYKIHDITGLQEQKLLQWSSKNVRTLWKTNRPQIFGRNKVANHKKKN